MYKKKYEVLIDGAILASDMKINIAMVLIKALFEYYSDESPSIVIREMARTEAVDCDRSSDNPGMDSDNQALYETINW